MRVGRDRAHPHAVILRAQFVARRISPCCLGVTLLKRSTPRQGAKGWPLLEGGGAAVNRRRFFIAARKSGDDAGAWRIFANLERPMEFADTLVHSLNADSESG